MGLLNDIGLKYNTDKSSLFHNYLDFYQEQLPDQSFDGRLLEIGIMDGNSMRMWREYYSEAEIVGIDIMPKDHLKIDGVILLQLNATDVEAMADLGYFDIVIDDGSHMSLEQQQSFLWFYYHQLRKNGFYVIEDLWTSYVPSCINSKYTTKQMLARLESLGMEMTYFKYPNKGLDNVFAGSSKLTSETVVIPAG